MIVEPDFLDHWKTRRLVQLLDYEAAPLSVIALWAHCQRRRTADLRVSRETFAAICRWPFLGDAVEKFYSAMLACGFIEERDDGAIVVHDWAKANATLIGRWRGGQTRGLALAKLRSSSASAQVELRLSEKSRVEKSRVEKSVRREERLPVASLPTDVGSNGSDEPSRPSTRKRTKLPDSEWIVSLSQDKAYEGIDVPKLHARMVVWCKERHLTPTRRRLLNWLNRQDTPMGTEKLGMSYHERESLINQLNAEKIEISRQYPDLQSRPPEVDRRWREIRSQLEKL